MLNTQLLTLISATVTLTVIILFIIQIIKEKKKQEEAQDGQLSPGANSAIAENYREHFALIESEATDSVLDDGVGRELKIKYNEELNDKFLIKFILKDLQNWYHRNGLKGKSYTIGIQASDENFTTFENLYEEKINSLPQTKNLRGFGCVISYYQVKE